MKFNRNRALIGAYLFGMASLVSGIDAQAFELNSGQIVSGGITRSFVWYVPDTYNPISADGNPLMIMLHGGGGNGMVVYEKGVWVKEADENGMINVYPNGELRQWNSFSFDRQGIDDVQFITDVTEYFETNYNINPDRKYLAGHSAGGQMVSTYQFLGNPGEFAATLAYKSGWMTLFPTYCDHEGSQCNPLDPCWSPLPNSHTTHMVVRGEYEFFYDQFYPYDRYMMDMDNKAFWEYFDGCVNPVTATVDGIYDFTTYDNCPFTFLEIQGESHETTNEGLTEIWNSVLQYANRSNNVPAEPAIGCCVGPNTKLNYYQALDGRAYRGVDYQYYAVGSNELLGRAGATSSLWEYPMWNYSIQDCTLSTTQTICENPLPISAYNLVHAINGRAYRGTDSLYYAVGSNDVLGAASSRTNLYECSDGYFSLETCCL